MCGGVRPGYEALGSASALLNRRIVALRLSDDAAARPGRPNLGGPGRPNAAALSFDAPALRSFTRACSSLTVGDVVYIVTEAGSEVEWRVGCAELAAADLDEYLARGEVD